ncbi:MAG: biotin/lipoyl-containing protein [Alphaproteobacteria bacterium]|tara:strand:+ start:285 stop:524 length:240 start_codon:yes stop_codon:yes gene_type:complete
MEKQITLPRLGETMDKGNISKWLIKENESFERGQTIAEIESDKTIVELPALESGKLVKILVNEGEEIEVGIAIATFETL